MRSVLRVVSIALITAGLVVLVDVAMTLIWKEPLSSVYGAIAQGEIEGERSGPLRVLGGVSAEGSSDGVPPLRSVIGDVAPEVASVIIERDEGEPVTATVRGGYFLAWWPTNADIVRITAYDGEGNALASI